MLFCTTGFDKLSKPSSDAHLPRIPKQKQQQQQALKESQTSFQKKDTNSVYNQTAFTDAREAAMLSQSSDNNATAKKMNSSTGANQTRPVDATGNNLTNSTERQSPSNMSSEDGNSSDDKELTVSELPAKKKHKKPRIIFHPEDKCRRSSKPSEDDDDDDDDVTDTTEGSGVLEAKDGISDAVDRKASSSKEQKAGKASKQEVATSSEISSTSKQLSGSTATPGSQYSDTYQSSEFRPYNPLPHTLEEKLFPRPFGPANFFDYPSWPDKTECLDVVENLSSWVKSSRVDIDMAKRGHK